MYLPTTTTLLTTTLLFASAAHSLSFSTSRIARRATHSRRETATLVGYVEAEDATSVEYLYVSEEACSPLKGRAERAAFPPRFSCHFFSDLSCQKPLIYQGKDYMPGSQDEATSAPTMMVMEGEAWSYNCWVSPAGSAELRI